MRASTRACPASTLRRALPARSISHDASSVALRVVVVPVPCCFERVALPVASSVGSAAARSVVTVARACTIFAQAWSSDGLSACAQASSRVSVSSWNCDHQSASSVALPSCGSGACQAAGARAAGGW